MQSDDLIQQWIELYYDRLTYIAYTYLHDRSAAEDSVQEALVKAYVSQRDLNDPSRPYPWLVRIVIHECLNRLRKQRRELPSEILPEQGGASTEDVYMTRSRNREVYSAVMSLQEKFRTPVLLYYFEELSVKEIAFALNMGQGAVKTRLLRGRAQLREKLEEGEHRDELGEPYSGGKTGLYPR
ncbi:RNA polymerase sigma factor [Paenibacillus gansuensis]|uniref:RNA polymerase sigma factor n=1 Tax=Paenibacillus gansuensis TaxID=306542 RepID=A0ABW5PJJ8_9BACL